MALYNNEMRRIRRNDMSARFEMAPMIDVIFVLLTFFVYSVVMMVRADVLPVKLANVTSGQRARQAATHVVTVDRQGDLYFNREPVTFDSLDARLREMAARPDRPTLYLAMEAEGTKDRAPVLVKVFEHACAAGLENFVWVGPPGSGQGAGVAK